MLSLFDKYCDNGRISEALLVGQNLLNKNGGNRQVFDKHFNLLISLANDDKSNTDERTRFLQQAVTVLAFYSENADLNEDVVNYINQAKSKLDKAADLINEAERLNRQAYENKMCDYNRNALEMLRKIISEIKSMQSETDFQNKLNQIGQLDASLEKDFFSDEDNSEYITLTKQCADIVDKKTQEFEHKKNIEYNLCAIQEYEKIYNMFKSGLPDNHLEVMKNFFVFDASRLFNETLVYYNHVYSFVLSKLDDNGKFVLTKYAIMCEKRR